MKIYNQLLQGTDEWLQVRAGKFTGSDFHTFFGNSEGKKLQLLKKACERITQNIEENTYTNANIERGKELEEEARLVYQENSFNLVEEVGFVELSSYVGCSPDGLVDEDGIIEIKCPIASTFLNHFIKGTIAIKPVYRTQIQFNLYVTNRKWCDYICYNPDFDNPIWILRIKRDEEYIQKIKDCLEASESEVQKIIEAYNVYKN